jgi:hypothetical protein
MQQGCPAAPQVPQLPAEHVLPMTGHIDPELTQIRFTQQPVPQPLATQQASPAAPHVSQMPLLQIEPLSHVLPAQHCRPAVPQGPESPPPLLLVVPLLLPVPELPPVPELLPLLPVPPSPPPPPPPLVPLLAPHARTKPNIATTVAVTRDFVFMAPLLIGLRPTNAPTRNRKCVATAVPRDISAGNHGFLSRSTAGRTLP